MNFRRMLHDKLVIVDKRYVVEGSVNWSISALKSNRESATLIDSPELAKIKLTRLKTLIMPPAYKEEGVLPLLRGYSFKLAYVCFID